jgi:hypothetical protein
MPFSRSSVLFSENQCSPYQLLPVLDFLKMSIVQQSPRGRARTADRSDYGIRFKEIFRILLRH